MTKLENISKLSQKEKEFLSAFSVLPENPIDINTIFELFAVDEENKIDFFDLIHDFSIKKIFEYKENHYFFKPEYKRLIITELQPTSENCSILIKTLTEKFFLPSRSKLEDLKKYIPYAESVINSITNSSNNLAVLANNFASFYENIGENHLSIKYIQKAIQIQEDIDIEDNEISFYYNNLAVLYTKIGSYDQSLSIGFESIRHLNNLSSKNYVTLANSYNIISTAYDKKKNYKQALNYSLKAIEIAEDNFRDKSILLAGYYHDIAITFFNLRNYQTARYYIEKAISNYSKKVKTEDSFMKRMLTYKNIFNMYYKLEKFVKKFIKYFLVALGASAISLMFYFIFIK